MEYKINIPGDEGRIEIEGNEIDADVSVYVGPDDDMCMVKVDVAELLHGVREIVRCVLNAGVKIN